LRLHLSWKRYNKNS